MDPQSHQHQLQYHPRSVQMLWPSGELFNCLSQPPGGSLFGLLICKQSCQLNEIEMSKLDNVCAMGNRGFGCDDSAEKITPVLHWRRR